MKGKSILAVDDFTPKALNELVTVSSQMKELVKTKGGDDRMSKRKLVNCVFCDHVSR